MTSSHVNRANRVMRSSSPQHPYQPLLRPAGNSWSVGARADSRV